MVTIQITQTAEEDYLELLEATPLPETIPYFCLEFYLKPGWRVFHNPVNFSEPQPTRQTV
jgi:hypothetical protein